MSCGREGCTKYICNKPFWTCWGQEGVCGFNKGIIQNQYLCLYSVYRQSLVWKDWMKPGSTGIPREQIQMDFWFLQSYWPVKCNVPFTRSFPATSFFSCLYSSVRSSMCSTWSTLPAIKKTKQNKTTHIHTEKKGKNQDRLNKSFRCESKSCLNSKGFTSHKWELTQKYSDITKWCEKENQTWKHGPWSEGSIWVKDFQGTTETTGTAATMFNRNSVMKVSTQLRLKQESSE